MPVRADFRLDAGFGTPGNVAMLIEMGYEVYTKPYGTWLRAHLNKQVDHETSWTQVGHNAEMTAWKTMGVKDFPYPLDVALERFYSQCVRWSFASRDSPVGLPIGTAPVRKLFFSSTWAFELLFAQNLR
jgi:hypothetical protein